MKIAEFSVTDSAFKVKTNNIIIKDALKKDMVRSCKSGLDGRGFTRKIVRFSRENLKKNEIFVFLFFFPSKTRSVPVPAAGEKKKKPRRTEQLRPRNTNVSPNAR